MVDVKPGTYTLGPSDGTVRIRTARDGMAAKVGHDLVLEVGQWSATVTVPNGDGSAPRASAVLDAGSLEVKEGSGGALPLSAKDMNEIKKNAAEKVLMADKHPKITFEATRVSDGGGSVKVDGMLTITGSQRPVSFSLAVDANGGAPRLKGSLPIKQTDFGIKPYKALMGALKVRDQIEIDIDVRVPQG